MIGQYMALVGAIITILGVPAAFVRNDTISKWFILYTGLPIIMLALVLVLTGALGWWFFVGAAVLIGMGYLCRPKQKAE